MVLVLIVVGLLGVGINCGGFWLEKGAGVFVFIILKRWAKCWWAEGVVNGPGQGCGVVLVCNKTRVRLVCELTRTNFVIFQTLRTEVVIFPSLLPRTNYANIPKIQNHFSNFSNFKIPRDHFCHFWIFQGLNM